MLALSLLTDVVWKSICHSRQRLDSQRWRSGQDWFDHRPISASPTALLTDPAISMLARSHFFFLSISSRRLLLIWNLCRNLTMTRPVIACDILLHLLGYVLASLLIGLLVADLIKPLDTSKDIWMEEVNWSKEKKTCSFFCCPQDKEIVPGILRSLLGLGRDTLWTLPCIVYLIKIK